MAKLYYGHIETEGLKIQYYRTGEEKPPLIFLHGATDNGMCWNRLPLVFEPEYDVVLIDARGHGLSDAPEIGYVARDHAGDVAAVIRELNLVKPVLIGHSMGADTAAAAAAIYPDLIKGVILEDPPWPYSFFGESTDQRTSRAERMRDDILSYKSMTIDEIIALCKKKHPSWHESECFQWAKAKQLVNPRVAVGLFEEREPWRELVKKIKCPGLLMTGNPGAGSIITPEVAEEVKSLWKSVEVINFAESGHNIHREQYREFRDEVKKYLRKLSRRKRRLW